MHSDTKLAATDATDAKHMQNRCLRDLDPVGEVPDQDSAPNP